MNPPKGSPNQYIDFLVATRLPCTCLEASRVQAEQGPAHHAIKRMLHQIDPEGQPLWEEARPYVNLDLGLLLIDDSTLDKPYSKKVDLMSYHWSGKHLRVVKGINLQTLIWTDGDSIITVDCNIYDKESGKTKTVTKSFGQPVTYE